MSATMCVREAHFHILGYFWITVYPVLSSLRWIKPTLHFLNKEACFDLCDDLLNKFPHYPMNGRIS